MTETVTRRGRPKGTGIDDGDRLAAIARLLADNPEMRPTTAIKAIGVSDPSIIRRLRDKYAEVAKSLAAELPRPQVPVENETPPLSTNSDMPPVEVKKLAAAARMTEAAAKPARRPRTVAATAASSNRRQAEPNPPAAVASAPPAAMPPARKPGKKSAVAAAVAPAAERDSTTTARSPRVAKRPSAPNRAARATKPAGAAPAPTATEPPAAIEARDAGPVTTTAHSETTRTSAVAAEVAPAAAPATAATTGPTATPRPTAPDDIVCSLLGLGLAATSTAFAAQAMLTNSFARTPFVTLALRQQLALNEWALRLVPVPRPARKTAS